MGDSRDGLKTERDAARKATETATGGEHAANLVKVTAEGKVTAAVKEKDEAMEKKHEADRKTDDAVKTKDAAVKEKDAAVKATADAAEAQVSTIKAKDDALEEKQKALNKQTAAAKKNSEEQQSEIDELKRKLSDVTNQSNTDPKEPEMMSEGVRSALAQWFGPAPTNVPNEALIDFVRHSLEPFRNLATNYPGPQARSASTELVVHNPKNRSRPATGDSTTAERPVSSRRRIEDSTEEPSVTSKDATSGSRGTNMGGLGSEQPLRPFRSGGYSYGGDTGRAGITGGGPTPASFNLPSPIPGHGPYPGFNPSLYNTSTYPSPSGLLLGYPTPSLDTPQSAERPTTSYGTRPSPTDARPSAWDMNRVFASSMRGPVQASGMGPAANVGAPTITHPLPGASTSNANSPLLVNIRSGNHLINSVLDQSARNLLAADADSTERERYAKKIGKVAASDKLPGCYSALVKDKKKANEFPQDRVKKCQSCVTKGRHCFILRDADTVLLMEPTSDERTRQGQYDITNA